MKTMWLCTFAFALVLLLGVSLHAITPAGAVGVFIAACIWAALMWAEHGIDDTDANDGR